MGEEEQCCGMGKKQRFSAAVGAAQREEDRHRRIGKQEEPRRGPGRAVRAEVARAR